MKVVELDYHNNPSNLLSIGPFFEIFIDEKRKMHQEYLSLGNFVTMSTGNYASTFLISRLIQMAFAGYI